MHAKLQMEQKDLMLTVSPVLSPVFMLLSLGTCCTTPWFSSEPMCIQVSWGSCHTQWWFALCASRWGEREWKMIVILLYTEISESLFLPMSVDAFIWILLSRKLPRNTEMPTTLEEAEKAKRHGKRTCSIFGQWDMRLGQPSNIP